MLIDTDVFISISRSKKKLADYAPHLAGRLIVLSFASVAELWLGANVRGYGDQSRRKLRAEIASTVVVPPTADLTHAWAALVAEARGMSPGHPLGQRSQYHDAWVAATARHYSLPLLTGNRRHFEGLPGLELLGDAKEAGL